MAQEHSRLPVERVTIVRGADDQLSALERLWAEGENADPDADERDWQTLRRALNETRRAAGARLLYEDE